MYRVDDTIAAVSSPTSEGRVIVRVSGVGAVEAVNGVFRPEIAGGRSGVFGGRLAVGAGVSVDAQVYLFWGPYSYTGDTVVEVHYWGNGAVTEAVFKKLLEAGVRAAEAGEFSARAYFNGKMDLSQAEAVNEIIAGSNRLQIAAAQRLLEGRLAKTVGEIREQIADLLSLLEAGMDFSEEDIEFISEEEAGRRLSDLVERLQDIISGNISYEAVIELPSVGLAGAPNAGKSSLLNALLESERSIVAAEAKTTRDVLAGQLALQNFRCVLFDCAGLTLRCESIIDTLAQQAAIEAIGKTSVVLFCADVSKDDWREDRAIYELAQVGGAVIGLATKADVLSENEVDERVGRLEEIFDLPFMPTSVVTGRGLTQLRRNIDAELSRLFGGAAGEAAQGVAITARHRQAVSEAIENLREATGEVKAGSGETAAVMLRAAYKGLSDIEHEHIDEKVLDNIFSRFCIGK